LAPAPEGTSDCADEVTLSHKAPKDRTYGRSVRGRKVRTRIGRMRESRAELEQQLEKYRRELTEARDHLAEALEQQTALPRRFCALFRALLIGPH